MEVFAVEIAPLGEGWQTILLGYGPLGVFACIVGWFVIWYGPRVIQAHLEFIKTCQDTLLRLSEAYERLSSDRPKTHKILGHLANAGKAAITDPDVHRHLDKALEELER